MKILHIFGAVVAVHLAVFLIIFAVPGCRTTGKPTRSANTSDTAPPSAPATGDSSPLVGAPASSPTSVDSSLTPSVSFPSSSPPRSSPTRPNSPLASAMQPSVPVSVTPATTYTVVKGDSLWKIARKHNLSTAELAAANHLNANTPLKLGQKLIISAKTPAPTGTMAQASLGATVVDGATTVHEVKSGESLGVIARMYGTTSGTLKRLNNLKSDTVRVGQKLALPEGVSSSPDTFSGKMQPTPASGGAAFKHTVKAGETLGAIAKRYGATVGEIAAANNLNSPKKIVLGQELIIPGWAPPKSTETPGTTTEPKPLTPAASPFEPVTSGPDGKADGSTKPAPSGDVPVIRVEDGPPAPPPGSGGAPRIF